MCHQIPTCFYSAIVKSNMKIKTKKLSIFWLWYVKQRYLPQFYLNCKFLFTISLVSLQYAGIRKFVNRIWSRILFSSSIIGLVSLWNCVRTTSLYGSHEPDCSTASGACNCVKELVKKTFQLLSSFSVFNCQTQGIPGKLEVEQR